jgi:hypothetical protein
LVLLYLFSDVHFGMELVKLDVKETFNGLRREATFIDLKTGQHVTMDFGTFLTTPINHKRKIYEGNNLADEHVKPLYNLGSSIG